ncbi:MAG: adenylyl-sulfate kinase [Actinomycetota bacterium]|nr:adenylyl-sulfate kinase [Actinomycetota bacterium]
MAADGSTSGAAARNLTWHHAELTRAARWAALGIEGGTIWFTGLSGSGKSTVAAAVERLLVAGGQPASMLDGDNVRHGLNGDLGFSDEDRTENVRRVGEVARLLADAGVVALVPVISPFRSGRDAARAAHEAAGIRFLEVFVDTPLEACEARDPKGLYAKARRGELTGMTGIDSPYEPPARPELVLRPADGPAEVQAARVFAVWTGAGAAAS